MLVGDNCYRDCLIQLRHTHNRCLDYQSDTFHLSCSTSYPLVAWFVVRAKILNRGRFTKSPGFRYREALKEMPRQSASGHSICTLWLSCFTVRPDPSCEKWKPPAREICKVRFCRLINCAYFCSVCAPVTVGAPIRNSTCL